MSNLKQFFKKKKKKKLPEYINKQSLNLLKDFLKSIETILN
jgi:hypothetical protein